MFSFVGFSIIAIGGMEGVLYAAHARFFVYFAIFESKCTFYYGQLWRGYHMVN